MGVKARDLGLLWQRAVIAEQIARIRLTTENQLRKQNTQAYFGKSSKILWAVENSLESRVLGGSAGLQARSKKVEKKVGED